MTIETALAWSIGRSLLVATVAVPISFAMSRICSDRHQDRRIRQPAIFVAVLPLLVPDLLTGFTYRMTSAKLLHSVVGTEGLYAGLLLLRCVALQVAVRLILPESTVGREALHSWKLAKSNKPGWIKMQVIGPLRCLLVGWLGGCLLCFQDFETAALLQINRHPIAWTVWLFDAHAAGEPLSNSLRYVLRSLVFQLLILLPAILLFADRRIAGTSAELPNTSRLSQPDERSTEFAGMIRRAFSNFPAVLFSLLSLTVVLIWPTLVNSTQLLDGMRSLMEQKSLLPRIQQILLSLTTCVIAAVLAVWICAVLRQSGGRWISAIFLLPGLCGSLVIGLVLLAAFQLPVLNHAYDTLLPMLLGQTLILLPRASLLVVLLQVLSNKMTHHSTKLMLSSSPNVAANSKHLLWQMRQRRWLLAVAILTHWSFWDVSIVSTLRPVRFEPIVTRLYNEMHYGRTATLIAITMLSMVIPLIVALCLGFVLKQFPQQKDATNG